MAETAVIKKDDVALVKDTPEPPKPPSPPTNDFDITSLVKTAGTLKLTDAQEAVLYAPVVEEDVEIRPDGLIYLPWMEYVTRMREAFGMEWAIIPQGMPRLRGDLVVWGFYLIVQGVYCSYALGEQAYQPTNRTMSYGDAIEGAKSNALMRLCKGIGISLELWRPKFIKKWKADNAESYKDGSKTKWRKKGQITQGDPIPDTPRETPPQQEANEKKAPAVLCQELFDQLLPDDKEKFQQNFTGMGKQELRKVYLAMQAVVTNYPQYSGE